MTKKKPTADSGYESRIGELEAQLRDAINASGPQWDLLRTERAAAAAESNRAARHLAEHDADVDYLRAALARAVAALEWCGGSGDFGPEGGAHDGWRSVVLPVLADPAGQKALAEWNALEACAALWIERVKAHQRAVNEAVCSCRECLALARLEEVRKP